MRKKIEWKKVTWYSQVAAIVLFIAVFALGFWLGKMHEASHLEKDQESPSEIS